MKDCNFSIWCQYHVEEHHFETRSGIFYFFSLFFIYFRYVHFVLINIIMHYKVVN